MTSGFSGGNDGGKGINDTPQGLKLQCEGHDVRYRNAWIKQLELATADTDFGALKKHVGMNICLNTCLDM